MPDLMKNQTAIENAHRLKDFFKESLGLGEFLKEKLKEKYIEEETGYQAQLNIIRNLLKQLRGRKRNNLITIKRAVQIRERLKEAADPWSGWEERLRETTLVGFDWRKDWDQENLNIIRKVVKALQR